MRADGRIEQLLLKHRVDLKLHTCHFDELLHTLLIVMVELFEILEQLLDALVIVHEHVDRIPLSATLRAGHGVSFLAGRCTKHQRYRSMLPRSSHGGAAGPREDRVRVQCLYRRFYRHVRCLSWRHGANTAMKSKTSRQRNVPYRGKTTTQEQLQGAPARNSAKRPIAKMPHERDDRRGIPETACANRCRPRAAKYGRRTRISSTGSRTPIVAEDPNDIPSSRDNRGG